MPVTNNLVSIHHHKGNNLLTLSSALQPAPGVTDVLRRVGGFCWGKGWAGAAGWLMGWEGVHPSQQVPVMQAEEDVVTFCHCIFWEPFPNAEASQALHQ